MLNIWSKVAMNLLFLTQSGYEPAILIQKVAIIFVRGKLNF